ncbi:MAG TPA: hypothetical protein VN697_15750 [Tepidiformaceae bacterium]|nr:hypothetical protein [Tepidiformaceae bacterium]
MTEANHDTHATPLDPNVAPTHLDVKTDFSKFQMFVCWALGVVAIVAGVVFGLTMANK